ncbi:hypothetical protein ETD83_16360 [Actinomadura soli]|uniref:Uncharacterized protein n=1 Tax=Actinomadura soli TaxID=2508997 RepID=A0A5C4JE11_9ACTN|nr:hypothetical protein [Actinomadura soli]TMR00622.1 hypothetical protein ETD83_16360 [Actinomadura soli]
MSALPVHARLVQARLTRSPVPDGGDAHVTAQGPHDSLGLTLTRFSVADEPPTSDPLLDEHLAICLDGEDAGWASVADVLLHNGRRPPECFSGLVVCTMQPAGRCTITVRDEPDAAFTTEAADAAWFASFVHAWLVTGHRAGALASMRITVRRAPPAAP